MTHRLTAYAQLILTLVFLTGYFWVLTDFVHGKIGVPPEWKETLQVLLGVLTSNIGLLMSYWFQRQRDSKDHPQ